MIKFVLLVNKQGQTRLSRYAVGARPPPALRAAFEGEMVRKCLTRSDKQVREKRREERRRGRWREGQGKRKASAIERRLFAGPPFPSPSRLKRFYIVRKRLVERKR